MHAKALAGQIAAAFVGTHAGRASLAVIDHDDDDSAAGRAFWKAIGEAKPACLPDIDAAQEDAFEQRAKGLIRLLRVDGGSQVESLHVRQFCLDLLSPSPSLSFPPHLVSLHMYIVCERKMHTNKHACAHRARAHTHTHIHDIYKGGV